VLTANGSGGLIFHNSTVVNQVEVASKTVAAFIQTDKAMYKPGQKGKQSLFTCQQVEGTLLV
jgi:hypothetical protein